MKKTMLRTAVIACAMTVGVSAFAANTLTSGVKITKIDVLQS